MKLDKTGRKVTPQEVEKEMKTKTSSGQCRFSAKECLSVSQIASFFSRLGNQSSGSEKPDLESDEDLMTVLADIDEQIVLENMQ